MRFLPDSLRKPFNKPRGAAGLILEGHKEGTHMSDWETRLEEAEAGAERRQAAEHEAEERFKSVRDEAQAKGDEDAALKSEEFHTWMEKRRETDEAWGKWATVMDEKQTR